MKALIVDDDLLLSDVISFTLRRAGFEVILAHDGKTALERFESDSPAVVVLDVEMPYISGWDVCRKIREKSATPILMLTVRDSDEDVVRGLGLGADDYITKPFSPAQLVARVQAVLRRSKTPLPGRLEFAGITLLPDRHAIKPTKGEVIALTALEYKLLETLVLNAEQVLTANTLIDRVWGPNGADKAMLKQVIYRLRRKLESDEHLSVAYIESVPGIGYALMKRP